MMDLQLTQPFASPQQTVEQRAEAERMLGGLSSSTEFIPHCRVGCRAGGRQLRRRAMHAMRLHAAPVPAAR